MIAFFEHPCFWNFGSFYYLIYACSVSIIELFLAMEEKKKDRPTAGGSHMSGVWGRNNQGKPYRCICREAASKCFLQWRRLTIFWCP
jgi:hypothetical protein